MMNRIRHPICPRGGTVALALVLAAAPAFGQQTRGAYRDDTGLPEDPAGRRITELIKVINSNDPEQVRAFISGSVTQQFREFTTMEDHLAVFADIFNSTRGVEFYGIRHYEDPTPDSEVVVILRNKLTDGWLAIVMMIEPQAPHLIAGLQFAAARPPSTEPAQKQLTDAEMASELERFLNRLSEVDAFSGAVLLARNGRVLYKGARGLASKSFGVPNKVDTKFNLGSMNKMFTGVAIAQLVQAGKLSLDDPLSKFISQDWLDQDTADKIRIKHLLTHTSGLGSYFNDTFMTSSRDLFRELDDYKPLIAGSQPEFEPGTDWLYSNTGMFLLGVVIEKVTGQSYFDYIRAHVSKPAGMVNTDCYDMDRPIPNLAIGYSPAAGSPPWRNNLYKHVIRGGPAGGGFSTVDDLLRFDAALRQHILLSPEYTDMVLSAKPELNSPNYGFGFGVSGAPGDRVVGHGGGFDGISANLDMFLDSGYTAVVLSNYDGGAGPVTDKIRELIARRRRD